MAAVRRRAASPVASPTAGKAATPRRPPGPPRSTGWSTTRSRSTTTRRATTGSVSRRGRWSGWRSTTTPPVTPRSRPILDPWVGLGRQEHHDQRRRNVRHPLRPGLDRRPGHLERHQPRQERRPARAPSTTPPRTSGWPARWSRPSPTTAPRPTTPRQTLGQAAARRDVATSPTPRASRCPSPARTTTGSTTRCTSRRAGPARCPTATRSTPVSTFLSIRTFYKKDADWSKVQTYLDGGAVPTFTYHRFWAQADIATAYAVYAEVIG